MKMETAVFGGGCFWCVEAAFKTLNGVIEVVPGYAGGSEENPTYQQVCSGLTKHAEVARVAYDPERISYKKLLDAFFTVHDPTTPGRQGHDVGSQYRSIILYISDEQRQEAEDYILALNMSKRHPNPVVTEVKELEKFWPAEEYHLDYYGRNPNAPYCKAVIQPKLEKLRSSQ